MESNGQQRQVVVITGASAGVGRAVVREFARRGARIGLIARGVDGLEAARREVEELGGEALVLPLDVADAEAIEDAASKVEAAFGPIDIWVNNAMTTVFAPIKRLEPAEIKRVTEVTYLGVVYGTMAALRRMLPRDRGTIVQVGSALAYRGIPLQAAYCGAKHAIQGFCDSLHSELLHDRSNVKLTMVNLPAVNTPQFDWSKSKMPRKAQPVPPIFQPEVVARAIVWAADHHRRELNVGWPTTKAIVGNNFFPGYADLYLARNGYSAQMTDQPDDPNRPSNLWEPLPGDRGAHGRFDDRALDRSIELDMNIRRANLGALAIAATTGLATALARRRNGDNTASTEHALNLSRELRKGEGSTMRRRRGIVALSFLSAAAMGAIALYQTGVVGRLPDLPLPMADADRVDASAEAYSRFDTPDGALGLGSYALTLALAAMGGNDRAMDKPWIPLALAGKVAFDALNAIRLSIDQFGKQKAFCTLCIVAAAATLATVPLAIPETRKAYRAMQGRA